MDEALSAKIEKVIADHVSEQGGFPGPWVLMAQYTGNDGVPSWMFHTPGQQYLYDTVALSQWLSGMVEHEQRDYWLRWDEGDKDGR